MVSLCSETVSDFVWTQLFLGDLQCTCMQLLLPASASWRLLELLFKQMAVTAHHTQRMLRRPPSSGQPLFAAHPSTLIIL